MSSSTQRPERVGEAEAAGRVEVAAGGEHEIHVGLPGELAHRARRHHVRLPRRRADAEQREQARALELVGELELLGGDLVEAAEVDVVAAGLEAGAASRPG